MANENLKGLYNTLVHTGYNPPAYDQFVQDMKDEKNLRGAWNTLRREGYTPPKFETFKADMGWTGTQKAGTSKQTGSGRGQVAQAARGAGGGSVMNAIRFMKGIASAKGQWNQFKSDTGNHVRGVVKGTSLGHRSEAKVNPKTGNWERKYYTVTGNEVGSEAEQSVQNLDWRDKWEATTEAGRRHHKLRMQNDFEDHVGAALSKWGGDDAAEKAWQLAEQRSSRELMKEVDKNARRSPLYDLAQASNVTGGLGADNVDMGIKAFASHLKYHDLQRMADDAWNRLGKEKQQGIAGEIYNALHKRYPEASDGQLREAAGKMARQQSDRRVYELAVQKNAPHNAADYFIRKALGQNAMVSLMMSGARAKAGTTGDMEARDVAEQRYGHGWVNKGAGIAGTVVGLMADPLTLVSAGAGSGAVKGSMWLGGKLLGKAAARKAARGLGGRIGAGVLGSAANLGTYMAGSEALDQARWGGKVEGVDPETGRYKIGGYDAGAVGKQLLHGLGMGAVTGTIAPLTGNVSDKMVNATERGAGKAAIRAGELGVGTVAEGTVFALPEFVSTYNDYSTAIKEVADPESPGYIADAQEREKKIEELRRGRGDAMMDVWTDNMAMMAGFKGQHLLKSAPRRIEELAKMPRDAHGNVIKAGFETRLRAMLEGQGNGQALTRDEKEELQRGGYDDLAELVEGYKQSGEVRKARQAKINEGKARGYSDELAAKVADDAGLELPYTRFEALMGDQSISEAARAKMYYYVTGNVLPMSTVMGSAVSERKDAKGNVTGYNVASIGANGVITSRNFDTKKRADVEVNRINRQAELNGIDMGEQHVQESYDERRMHEACRRTSAMTGAPTNMLIDMMKRSPEQMNEVEAQWAEQILGIYDKLGDKSFETEPGFALTDADTWVNGEKEHVENFTKMLEDVGREYGVDVDKAIKKESGRRSEQESKAVEEYARRLYESVKRDRQAGGGDMGDLETGGGESHKMLTSRERERGRRADAQERRDIAIELGNSDPNSAEGAEKQEAWRGVVERIGEEAAYRAAQQRERGKKMQHRSDGGLHPATLKEKDKQVYIVDGKVEMTADGEAVDPERSDKSVVIYDPSTGERKMISPSADTGIRSTGEVVSAEDYEAEIQRGSERYIQTQIDAAQGKVSVTPGQGITLPSGEQGVVVAVSGDGEDITVRLEGGKQETVQRSELQRIADEAALADYRQRHTGSVGGGQRGSKGEREPQEWLQPQRVETNEGNAAGNNPDQGKQRLAGSRIEGAPEGYSEGMELTVLDEDGTEKPAMVMAVGRMEYNDGVMKFVPDANGNTVEYLLEGEVRHENIATLGEKVRNYLPAKAPEGDTTPQSPEETPAPAEQQPTRAEATPPAQSQPVTEQSAPVQPVQPAPAAQEPTAQQPTHQAAARGEQTTPVAEHREQSQAAPEQPQGPATGQEQEPMPMKKDGEEDWATATPERAHRYIYGGEAGLSRSEAGDFVAAQLQAANAALGKAKAAPMPKMGTIIKKYNEAKAKRQQKIDEAQRVLDYWKQVKGIQDKIELKESEARAERDRKAHEAAVREARADYEARKRAEAERKAVGNENPMPAITEKWNNAEKIDGVRDEIVLPNGERVKGHYVLHESGASSPSHDPTTWQKREGFPMDANGGSVNDRDYEHDRDAQQVTEEIAKSYDQRALQTPVVVSQDGVVLSGNGRTMAGELAARDNTDGAYIDYLKEYAPKYGFTSEQVDAMQHPRVSFVPDEKLPYTAETFAKFNQQEMKSQNKTEQAVKLGKTVSDEAFKRIVRTINGYDTLGAFYGDADASPSAVQDLHRAGVIPQAQLAEMVDGVRGQEKLSAVGREFLENMLIGKAFDNNPEAVRMLTAIPSMRQSVITALGEISDNIALGEDWSLQDALADAVKLCFEARTSGGFKFGDIVSVFARQGKLFAAPDELQTAADFHDATMMMLADVLNDSRVTMLKTTFALYNNEARESAAGQMDLFTGDVPSREDILRNVITTINNGNKKAIEAARAAAVERRKAEGAEQDGTAAAGGGAGGRGNAPADEQGGRGDIEDTSGRQPRDLAEAGNSTGQRSGSEEVSRRSDAGVRQSGQAGGLNEQDADAFLSKMEDNAVEIPTLELNPANWLKEFGEDGVVTTPIAEVKMGANQIAKLFEKGRSEQFGMIKPTLEHPLVIIEVPSNAIEGETERGTSWLFVKTFLGKKGEKIYYFKSVTVKKDGLEVSVSSHFDRPKRIKDALIKGKLLYRFDGGAQTEHRPADVSVTASPESAQGNKREVWSASEEQNKQSATDNTLRETDNSDNPVTPNGNVSNSSAAKGSENSATVKGKGEKSAENQTPNAVQAALAAAEQPKEIVPDVTQEGSAQPGAGAQGDGQDRTITKENGTEESEQPAAPEKPAEPASPKEKEAKPSGKQLKPVRQEGGQEAPKQEKPSQGDQGNEEDTPLTEQKLDEIKKRASKFATESEEESNAFSSLVPKMSDEELLAYMRFDGNGDLNAAYHAEVYDEYDGRHADEQVDEYNSYIQQLMDSGTTKEQAEDMLANVRRDYDKYGATAERPTLGGQQEALMDYIDDLNRQEEKIASSTFDRGFHRSPSHAEKSTAREAALRDAVIDLEREAGLDVIDDAEEGQRVLDMANDAQLDKNKKRALETVSPNLNGTDHQTAISSADGAKVLKNLDTLVKEYENSVYTKEKTFIGEVADALGIPREKFKDKSSRYATFETKNGNIITIRLSNHNATPEKLAHNGQYDAISIVVTNKPNKGMANDGTAHVVEYYYNAIKLRKAEGKPLAEIVRSIRQALYSGEFKDTTGLAERQVVNADVQHGNGVRFFRTADGKQAYGFTVGGKIYIDPRIATSETPIHEYAHLWAEALRKANPKEWQNVVELMKGCKTVWEQVKKEYPELKTDDEIADEVLAHYSGQRGAERLRAEADKATNAAKGVIAKAEVINVFNKLREAIKRAWKHIAEDILHIHFTSAEEAADKVMHDLLRGFDPRKVQGEAGEDTDPRFHFAGGDGATEDTAKYRIREDAPPAKTGIGYKAFVLKDGKLYPPMVANPGGEATPVGMWLDADAAPVAGVTKTGRQQVKSGGKGTQGGSGRLAYRPGWHLGTIPYALQFNRVNPETGRRELFPANFVWAEVEYAADKDYQDEAMSYGMKASGKFQHSLAGLPRVPENGSYMYRTNPDPRTDPWIITGAMKVKRVLTPSEVDEIVRKAGREPQPRQEGAVTDEQINKLNAEIERTGQQDETLKHRTAEQLAAKLNTPMRIVEDVEEITHSKAEVQERRRRAKGWYDTRTGEVVVVLPNNRDAGDVAATVMHETVAHKGLREMIGQESYDEFLDQVHDHLTDELKKEVDERASRAFLHDVEDNGARAKSREEHQRRETDELLGRLAEKGFEDFDAGERTVWRRIKEAVRRVMDKFLGSLKLPSWFRLGDNELRYMLWRSKERLEHGREHPIDVARDVVKREELGLSDDVLYRSDEVPGREEIDWDATAGKEALALHLSQVPARVGIKARCVTAAIHDESDLNRLRGVVEDELMVAIEKDYNNPRVLGASDPRTGMVIVFTSKQTTRRDAESTWWHERSHLAWAGLDLADKQELGLAALEWLKNNDQENYRLITKHYPEKQWAEEAAVRLTQYLIDEYGAEKFLNEDVYSEGKVAKLVAAIKNQIKNGKEERNRSRQSARATVSQTDDSGVGPVQPGETRGQAHAAAEGSSGAPGGSQEEDQGRIRLEIGPETEDIWNDGSMGLDERITAAATRLAANHQGDKTLRVDAMRAIGGNLTKLRQAMSLQRKFDRTTVKRVADLARVLMNSGYLSGLSQQEVKRLLAAVKNAAGKENIEGSVQKVMDIMVDNQLKRAKDTLHQLEAIKGSKVDARGVEVQGWLDPDGQTLIKAMKEAQKIVNQCGGKTHDEKGAPTAWGNALESAQMRMSSNDQAVADAAALEYAGMQMAQQWFDTIQNSKLEELLLRQELKSGYVDDSGNPIDNPQGKREWRANIEEAIRQNKIERAQSYFDLVGRLSNSLRESIANAKDFKEAEKQRIREIQHNANSDMEGRPCNEHYRPKFMDKFVNNSFVQFFFSPLATFDQMLRMFGGKSANGEGYLYNRYMRGWVDSRQKEIKGVREKYAILDRKAAELFGGKVKSWGDLIGYVGKLPRATVSFWNGGEMQEHELRQGNLMYIYMVNKMLDGRMKLRKMGITEENVADIEEVLDPRLIELADWLQDEFLVQTRNEYNETHKRVFGASMAAVEHYFPLRVLKNAIDVKAENLDKPEVRDGISTITGSIIKRRRNSKPLDILNADALHVILDHVAEMEHWNAFAEFNRDLNTLRSYRRFRNQVQNMTTIYGSGKVLWKKFNDVCQMTAGTYRPPRVALDTAAVNFAKGVTAAKVSFRIFTALKQFLSAPAYIPEARADYLLADVINPVKAWNWSMKNLPIFNERWHSRMAGDPRLLKSDMDWKMWRSRIVQLASRVGMSPNAFIDALTVAIGAHSMYRTRLGQYLRDGYGQAEAERRANQDAEILYNQTQQSSEGPFTSTMQVDRSWLSILFTVFRNASMAYQRQLHDALRNFKHNLSAGGHARSIAFMTKQLVRDGIDEETAGKSARRKFRRQLLKDTLRVATFGAILQFFWNLGPYVPYLLFGDDDDEKKKMWDDIWAHTAFGWLEGFTGGDVMSQGGEMLATGEGNPAYMSKDMPLTSDLMNALQKFGNGQRMDAVNDIVNIVVQSGIGVNPQSITDAVLAIMDACGDDPELAHEAAICVSRILQVPQSQIDKMYFDEVGLSGEEVSKYTPEELAERYARYKVKRGRFIDPWSWGDEERTSGQVAKANKAIKERLDEMSGKAVNEAYERHAEVYKGIDEKMKAARKAAKSDYVEAARIMTELQKDRNFRSYMEFKQMDSGLDKIAGMYLHAKTEAEAELCKRALVGYKKGMVEVLEAKDDASRAGKMSAVNGQWQDFMEKYMKMQESSNEHRPTKQ